MRSSTIPCAVAIRSRDDAAVARGFGAGCALGDVERAATAITPELTRWPEPRGGVILGHADAAALAAVLCAVLRGDDVAVAVLLSRPVLNLPMNATRTLDLAASAPLGVAVDAAPRDPRQAPMLAALRLIAVTMRGRSDACWRALDAVDAHAGNAQAAARTLGCSGPAVRTHRSRGHHAATAELAPLLAAILEAPSR